MDAKASIDLRSDTVTRPGPAMREAMARAPVGDDVYGEDPTVNSLQERVAALLGKEAALFVPSGTMANQIAIYVHTEPGDEVIIGEGAHCMFYESGAGPALSGVQFHTVGSGGLYTVADLEAAVQPDNHHYAPTRLCAVENTHNRGGGVVFPQDEVVRIAMAARRHGLALHLDGARLWNAHVATGKSLAELAAPFDTIAVCLSKGLGAPVGSLIVGARPHMHRAHRRRKMLGGGMRQAGVLAAAGHFALDHHLPRLAADHAAARLLAERLAALPGVELDLGRVQTNIVIWNLTSAAPLDAAAFVERSAKRGLLLNSVGPRRLRAVTHLDVDAAGCERAAQIAAEVLRQA